MKLAVVSDIHGNMEAFQQVLDDIDRCCVDETICLGDNIGYGPEPNEVIQALEQRNIISVLGNHELAIKDKQYLDWFNALARESLLTTDRLLSEASRRFISNQPSSLSLQNCRFVHGFPPDAVLTYVFQVPDPRIKIVLEQMTEKFCFVGHTHLLEIVSYNGQSVRHENLHQGIHRLRPDEKYIFNVGSVGQPRDGNNRAKYVIWDSAQDRIEVRFVAYDIATVASKIKKAGLPLAHADRLW